MGVPRLAILTTLRAWLKPWITPATLGERGERAAERFLRKRGYRVLARRERTPRGEIDLVMLDGRTIVFVEVKTRESDALGHPTEAVTHDKQRRLTRLAVTFLKRHRLLDRPARFDVVAVVWPPGTRRPRIEHYPNAFEAVGKGEWYS